MRLQQAVEYFIHPKDVSDPDRSRKARFFIVSMSFFFFLSLFSFPLMLMDPSMPLSLFWLNTLFILLLGMVVPLYKQFGKRIALVNFVAVLGYLTNWVIYEAGGGIFAPDNLWGIVICCWVFLVADKRSGLFWFAMTLLSMIVFFWAEKAGLKDFKTAANRLDSAYYFFNYSFAILFIAIIIFLHESGKDKFLQQLRSSKLQVEIKGRELELKNKDITDSINYAKRIQYAVLPQEETICRSIPASFIYYRPKDIVSGDFFWFYEINRDEYLLVCADCTGHGVPGAFMTVIGSSILNQTVIDKRIYEPPAILNELDQQISFTLKQQAGGGTVQDGMDLVLLKVNRTKRQLQITSAKRPVIFIRQGELQEIKGSKFSLGGMRGGVKSFDVVTISFEENDMFYFFTDGLTDQFGGEKGKKFSSRRLKETLAGIHLLSISEQKAKLGAVIENWMGDAEQVDDMLLIGVKM